MDGSVETKAKSDRPKNNELLPSVYIADVQKFKNRKLSVWRSSRSGLPKRKLHPLAAGAPPDLDSQKRTNFWRVI